MKRKRAGSRISGILEEEPQPKGKEGRHTPLQLLIYLRNPENAAVLDENYIALTGNDDTKAKKSQRKRRRKAFQDYIEDSVGISNEPRNPEKPMHKFIHMPHAACEYIKPTLVRMLKEQDYATYFKKTDFDFVDESKLHSVTAYIERILNSMGKKVGPPRNSTRRALVEEDISKSNASSPRKEAAETQTPVAKRDNNEIEIAVSQVSLTREDTKMVGPGPEVEVELLKNISRLYCAVCKEMLNPEPWFVSLCCIHRVCSRCASLKYRWNKYVYCQFCKAYVQASCRRTPDGSPNGLTNDKNVGCFVKIDQTGYNKLEFSAKREQFMNNLESGGKLVFAGIRKKEDFFLGENEDVIPTIPATGRKVTRASSVEAFDVDVGLLFANLVEVMRRVEKLVAISCEVVPENILKLIKCNTQSIVYLNLCNCKINDDVMKVLVSHGDEFDRIQELILEENRLTKNSGPLVASFVRNKPDLCSLILNGNRLGEGYLDIVRVVTGSLSMKFLGLGKNEITSLDLSFVDMLRSTALVTLTIHTNLLLGSQGTALLASGLAQNHTIKFLWIRNIAMGDSGAEIFAKAIATNDSVIEIGMGHNEITEKGASHIAAALRKNKRLAALYLNGNRLTARNVREFTAALGVNRSLLLLGIQGVGLKSDSAEAIYELIRSAKGLKYFLLGKGEFMSQEERKRLVAWSKDASERGEAPYIQV